MRLAAKFTPAKLLGLHPKTFLYACKKTNFTYRYKRNLKYIFITHALEVGSSKAVCN